MSVALGVPHGEYSLRPSLTRSRSHSTPTRKDKPADDNEPAPRPQRPSHGRSQSYLAPTPAKPGKTSTDPVDGRGPKNHRLHLGKHHLHRDEHRKHRYTQSEVEQNRGPRRQHGDDSLPHLIAGLKREGGRKADPEMLSAVPGNLSRMMSTRSYRNDTQNEAFPRNDLRRRATSDPRAPVQKKNPIEEDLERADRIKRQRKFTITKTDVARRDAEIAAAEDELRDRLEDVNAQGTSMTRKLDYSYYNILEKVGNLMGTIQSFQSLAQQSKQLISNFEHETERVEEDMKRRIGHFKHTFEQREARVDRLETRGRTLGMRAEDLGRRLETARAAVATWEKRESKSRKVWGRFWGGIWWSSVSIIVLILAIVMTKEWWFRGDPVKAALRVPPGGSHNASLSLGEGKAGEVMLANADIPEDVKSVLKSIEERNKKRKGFMVKQVPTSDREDSGDVDDKSFRALDEL